MRLSRWDFRPTKRSKYVSAELARNQFAPPRKRPTIRIFLLVAFGLLVYLKYDDFVRSPVVQKIRQPEVLWKSVMAKIRGTPDSSGMGAAFPITGDSTRMQRQLICASANSDSCLQAWTFPGPEEKGEIRAWLMKARIRWPSPEPTAFSLYFSRVPKVGPESEEEALEAEEVPADKWSLDQIQLRRGESISDLAFFPNPDGSRSLCVLWNGKDPRGECLVDPAPRPPLRLFPAPDLARERPPVLVFSTQAGEPFHPVLPGKIIDLPKAEDPWMKVYHGRNTFSYYAGFAKIRPGLAEGALVGIEDTLGFAGATDTSMDTSSLGRQASTLSFRIEKDGSPEDPRAFLDLEEIEASKAGDGKEAHVP